MLKINHASIENAKKKRQIKLAKEFLVEHSISQEGESLHVILTLKENFMYSCQYIGGETLELALGSNGELISLQRDGSEESVDENDIAVFLEKGKNLHLCKIIQKKKKIKTVDILSIINISSKVELVDVKENRVLAVLGVNSFKQIITLEDFSTSSIT
jgi:hypothetical protein